MENESGVGRSSSSSSRRRSPSMGRLYTNIQPLNYTYNFSSIAHSQPQGSNSNAIFESMNRATPYTPEEKKERILRYRSKRNLRNFNKKIKYECRKSLADRRPRVKGRFARINDQRQSEYSPIFLDQQDTWDWINILDALNKLI